MKKSIIKEIYYGNRGNSQTFKIPKSENFEKNSQDLVDTYAELERKIRPENLELHQKLVDALADDYCDEVSSFFVEGFKLGVLIGIECMEE